MGKYNLISLEPTLDLHLGAAHGGADVLFGWQEVEIPKGACSIKTIAATIGGTNGAAGNTHDMHLYFARSINGVAPASFGTEHAVNTEDLTCAFRRNLLGFVHLDLSSIDDSDVMRAYSVLGTRVGVGSTGSDPEFGLQMLQGDPDYNSTEGYQTIWIGAMTRGAFDFGTDVLLNMGSHQAASTTAVQITTDGTDPRLVFQPGDSIVGSTGTVEMEVVSVTDGTNMAVKNISAQIDHQEQLILKNPMVLQFGFEY